MNNFDYFGIIFDFWTRVFQPFAINAYEWLFNSVITIGEYEIIPFYVVGGSLFFVLIVLWLRKKII